MKKPESMKDTPFHYCAGCGHGIIHRLIAEVIDELGIRGRTIGLAPVGCGVLLYNYFDFDILECAHGRIPAAATAVKRCLPDRVVFTYQGDGDLAAIGTNEIIHAANRGENLTAVFVNNATYGMTGGQMAPTTLTGQKTTTSPAGRGPAEGRPLRVCELLATLDGTVYIERTAVHTPRHVSLTKKALRKAFQVQLDGRGFALVEILSMCPVNWKMSAREAVQYVDEMAKVFKLGVVKDL